LPVFFFHDFLDVRTAHVVSLLADSND
jgi:hypothetical protein